MFETWRPGGKKGAHHYIGGLVCVKGHEIRNIHYEQFLTRSKVFHSIMPQACITYEFIFLLSTGSITLLVKIIILKKNIKKTLDFNYDRIIFSLKILIKRKKKN